MQKSATVNILTSVVKRASRAWSRDIGEIEGLQASPNGVENFVKASKRKTIELLIKEISEVRPNWSLLIRDKVVIDRKSDYVCIIDPLNGELNFLNGFGHCAISIGLQNKKESITGVIYDPIRDEMFWGEKGQGAYMNHQRLRVSSRDSLENSLLALKYETHKLFIDSKEDSFNSDSSRFLKTKGIRNLGSVALDLAYVAAGRFDGMCRVRLNLYEFTAGLVIVREAGGVVQDITQAIGSSKLYDIIASNSILANSLTKILRKV